MSQNSQKTVTLKEINFKDKFHFYQSGKIIRMNLEKQSDFPNILEKLKKNKNLEILSIPKEIFEKKNQTIMVALFEIFSIFNIQLKNQYYIISKRKQIGTAECVEIPFEYHHSIEKKNLLTIKY